MDTDLEKACDNQRELDFARAIADLGFDVLLKAIYILDEVARSDSPSATMVVQGASLVRGVAKGLAVVAERTCEYE